MDRQVVLDKVRNRISTHACPECGGPVYCAMEDGKSANLCWCMTETPTHPSSRDWGTSCLCRRCLMTESQ